MIGTSQAAADIGELPDITGLRIVRRLHWGRWLASLVIVGLLALLVRAFAHGQIDWAVVGQFLTASAILDGIGNTVLMAVLAMALGIVLGVAVAVMRISPNPVLRWVAIGYTWLFRGMPVILQLLLWYNLALIFPVMGWPGVVSARTVDVMTPFVAAMLGLGINQGAYTSEVVRAGMMSVDTASTRAAQSIGMTRLLSLRQDHPAAGDAGGDPAARQRVHRHDQADLAGQRDPVCRSAA